MTNLRLSLIEENVSRRGLRRFLFRCVFCLFVAFLCFIPYHLLGKRENTSDIFVRLEAFI